MIYWYTKLLSYLKDQHIESVESDHNQQLDLYMVNNRLQLCTQNAIYSYDDFYYNFRTVFLETDLPKDDSKVLVLGLGLGSIPFILEKYHNKKYQYTGIEIDESVLYLFGKYQASRLTSPIDIYETDALHFLKTNNSLYDMICIDIFIGENIPNHVKQIEFLEQIHNHLTINGLVMWNTLFSNAQTKQETSALYQNLFANVFKNTSSIDVLGNKMLIGYR
ncbi:spermidine synthase [Membranihabitans marinus]|uniref:spermidine synthase n=1 Tax=Membranihabitans marinus TaxID=1227546 RepID=UPI001F182F1E|nr:hypothetical protein [Membranihabitans marinus]